jgi:hypothetical protein
LDSAHWISLLLETSKLIEANTFKRLLKQQLIESGFKNYAIITEKKQKEEVIGAIGLQKSAPDPT